TGLRHGRLHLPHLASLGLGEAARLASGRQATGFLLPDQLRPGAFWGAAEERSQGKDTPSGHWEIAGVPVPFAWGYFPETVPAFPAWLTDALISETGLPGILGNKHASGTTIIAELGEEHVRTGKPIC